MAARILRTAAAAAAAAACLGLGVAPAEATAEACLATAGEAGRACGEEQVELDEDAAADLLRFELLQTGLARQTRTIEKAEPGSEVPDQTNEVAASADQLSTPAAANRTSAERVAEAPQQLNRSTDSTEHSSGAAAASNESSAEILAEVPQQLNHPAAPAGRQKGANATTSTLTEILVEANADIAQIDGKEAEGSPAHVASVGSSGGAAAKDTLSLLLVEADAAISQTAAQQVQQHQMPEAFKNIFGGAVDAAKQGVNDQVAQTLETSLNSSLSVVLDTVDDLPTRSIQLREAMFKKVNATSGNVNASLAGFETAVNESIGSFLLLWSPVLLALEALHAAVPSALRVAGLTDLASTADAALGAGPGLLGLANSFAASLRNISSSVAGLGHASHDVAGRQLAVANEAMEEFLAQADNLAATFLKELANMTSTAAETLKAPSGTFASVDQTANAIVEDVSDSAHELTQGISEASSLTDVEPAAPKSAAAGVPLVRLVGWLPGVAASAFATAAA